jgi:hypothetical protein
MEKCRIIIFRYVISYFQVSKTMVIGFLFTDWTFCTGSKSSQAEICKPDTLELKWDDGHPLQLHCKPGHACKLIQQRVSSLFHFEACMTDLNKPFIVNGHMKDLLPTIAWKYVSLYYVQMQTYGRWYMQALWSCKTQTYKCWAFEHKFCFTSFVSSTYPMCCT